MSENNAEKKYCITMADILASSIRCVDEVVKTPLSMSVNLSRTTKCNIFLKLENLQRCKCFKFRGAYNKLRTVNEGSTIITVSDGNHSQGVSHAAKLRNCKCIVYMPKTAVESKISATKQHGTEVRLVGKDFGEACKVYEKECSAHPEYIPIHPFDDPDVIAANGVIGMEILEANPNINTIVVPIGGGGLASGIAFAVKNINPNVRIIGVNAYNCASSYKPFKIARNLKVENIIKDTISPLADGINIKEPGKMTLPIITDFVDDIVLVNEDEIAYAVAILAERGKIITEGSGAATFAAVLNRKFEYSENENIACVISGGNIPLKMLSRCIDRALFLRGDRVAVTVIVPYGTKYFSQLISLLESFNAEVVSCTTTSNIDTSAHQEQYSIIMDVVSAESLEEIRKACEDKNWGFKVQTTMALGDD